MIGLGTIINVIAIVVGGLLGLCFSRILKERYQETVIKTLGFSTIIMAIGSALSRMLVVNITETDSGVSASLDTQGVMMMIISLALGALLGEIINLDRWINVFGAWLRDKSGNSKDTRFIDAFVVASLTVSIGAMAIIGALQDGIDGDYNTLLAKSILDMMLILMLTASMGKGCIFSAIPVGILQGSVTLLARFIAPIMTDAAVNNLSLVGNVIILCVGCNIVRPGTIRVANMLPAIVIAVIFALV